MSLPDEKLMAYADGEADAETRLLVEAAMRSDPRIAQRVTQYQNLRATIHDAYAADLNAPVPDALLRAARGVAVDSIKRTARQKKRQREHWARRAPVWTALAASLVLGIGLGITAGRYSSSGPSVTAGLVAGGELADALTTQLASTQTAAAKTRIGVSFIATNGAYCRTFALTEKSASGLACRNGKIWEVQVLTSSPERVSAAVGFQQAESSIAPAILGAVADRINGEPLDAASEMAARDANWQSHPASSP